MATIAEIVETAFRTAVSLETGAALQLTFGSESHDCFQGDPSKSKPLTDGGYEIQVDVVVFTVLSDWTTPPAEGDRGVYLDGVEYRVIGTIRSVNDPVIGYQLGNLER